MTDDTLLTPDQLQAVYDEHLTTASEHLVGAALIPLLGCLDETQAARVALIADNPEISPIKPVHQAEIRDAVERATATIHATLLRVYGVQEAA